MRRLLRLGFGLAAAVPFSCSLGNLGEFDIPTCDDNAKCDPLNEYHGLSRQHDCRTYHCRSDGDGCELRVTDYDGDGSVSPRCRGVVNDTELDCEDEDAAVHPGSDEVCDGKDNDCDGVIDEGIAPDDVLVALKLDAVDADAIGSNVYFGNPKGMPVESSDRDPSPVFVCSADEQAFTGLVGVPQGEPPGARALAFAYQREQDAEGFEEPAGDYTCPTARSFLTCVFDDTVATPIDGSWIVAAVSRTGCRAGQLRIGYLEDEAHPEVGLRGPEQVSNIYLGVDVGDNNCTGASRQSGVEGVTRPALAGQNGDPRQALVAFIADAFDRDACGGSSRDVEVLGVWLEDNVEDLMWTNGANDGVPQVLGRTSGGGRPVVQALDFDTDAVRPGYLVAYGVAGGGLGLHRLPLFEDPERYVRGQEESRSTDPIVLGTRTVLFSSRDIDHVAVTQVGFDGDDVVLGLAWLEGCGSEDAEIFFARGRYDPDDHSFGADEPVSVARVAGLKAAPSLVHVDAGFVSSAFERDGRAAKPGETGGFFVAYRDLARHGQLTATRILDLDGQVLDTVVLDTNEAPDTPVTDLFYAKNEAYFACYQAAKGEVRIGPLLCHE